MWSHALGADVTVISHSKDKEADAKKLGANHFICTDDKDWTKGHEFEFDFLLNTANYWEDKEIADFFGIIKVNGHFQNVGMPDNPITIKMQQFASNGCYLGTTHIGNREEMLAMLELASKQNIKSWVETIQIGEEGCKEAVTRVKNGDRVRYRFTLTGFDKVFGKRA